MSARRFWVFAFDCAMLWKMRFAPSLIALGMCVSNGSCSRSTTPSGMCMRTLSNGGCTASYAEAIAPGSCADFPFTMFISECGGRHVVEVTIVDEALACSYNAAGVLVGSRECSKPNGDCRCFYAGEMVPDSCDGPTTMVACEDAGKPAPDSAEPSAGPSSGLERPAPSCGLPQDGKPCTCPGTEVCPSGAAFFSKCMSDGSWASTDHSCVLGLSCQVSTDTWAQLCHARCEPDAGAPCPSDQVCTGADACCGGVSDPSACSTAGVLSAAHPRAANARREAFC